MSTLLEPLQRSTAVGNHFVSNYPPFSTWTPEELPNLTAALERKVASPQALSLYVHVPFCRQRCHYCYFRVYPRRTDEEVDLYFTNLLREFSLYEKLPAIAGRRFHSIYFGGGTPTYPKTEVLRKFLETLRSRSNWARLEEFTFECEPGTASLEKFQMLKECGVTRLSLGFQTLHDELLRRSGRDLTTSQCIAAYEQARRAGFDQINVDLLAGLPGESETSWHQTVQQVTQLEPDCVTIYQLELTHNSGLYHSMQNGRDPHLTDWPTKRAWVRNAFARLEEIGYTITSGYMAVRDPGRWRFAYTVDHFWRGYDLLALGESAFGHIQGVHYQNVHRFDRYTGMLEANQFPWRRAHQLTFEEKWRREFILQLKTGSVETRYFRDKFDLDLASHLKSEFEYLAREGFLEFDSDCIRLTRSGLLDVDWLLTTFYLPEHRGVRYT